jgi:hypothetical protein
MRTGRPIRLAAIAMAVTLTLGASTAQAQGPADPVADAFCALFTPEEIEGVLDVALAATPGAEACTWAPSDGGMTSATASWYGGTIADHQALFPTGTDLTIGERTAWFSPGMFLQELLVELDDGVLYLVITGYDGDVEAALVELGELAVARADALLPPAPDPTVAPMDADPALEAQFPATIGGEPLDVYSMSGADFISDPDDVAAVTQALGAVGKTLDDVTVAIAFLPDGGITAIRVAGADASALAQVLLEGVQGPGLEMVPAQVAGKDVSHIPSIPAYVYTAGDVVWVVQFEEPALSEVFAALP